MYAVIQTGGKQYRVTEGDIVRVEKLGGDVGSRIVFDAVLSVGDGDAVRVGKPRVKGATVEAEIVRQGRERKIRVYTYKRRKSSERTLGHRQEFTELKIGTINPGSSK